MFDFGIEWVHYNPPADFDRQGHYAVWFGCGCCAVVTHGRPALLFSQQYVGEGRLSHSGCTHCWSFVHHAAAPPARMAEIVAAMRWIDEGGCPTHNPQALDPAYDN